MADHQVADGGKAARKRIFVVLGILSAVTALEFLIALAFPGLPGKNIVFIVLTIVKAFFIVADFMHLKHEVKALIFSILIPMIFIVWLLIAGLVEGKFYCEGYFDYL